MSHYKNIESIKQVYRTLGKYADKVIFIGGAVVSLYVDRDAEEVRPTEDVDVLVEIYSPVEYGRFEETLRSIGFSLDKEAGFIGRFKIENITVDVMPVEGEKILGFGNAWYKRAFDDKVQFKLDKQIQVNILPPALFVATKLEAFNSRGNKDGRTSEDFEDIVFILSNRSAIWNDMRICDNTLKNYLKNEFARLLSNKYLEEWIAAHSTTSTAKSIISELARFSKA